MNAEQLWETTMNPEGRTLRQVTIENAAECDQIFSMLWGMMFHLEENLLRKMLNTLKLMLSF
jgi:DNA gyrase/topoisomerase IV subunit B